MNKYRKHLVYDAINKLPLYVIQIKFEDSWVNVLDGLKPLLFEEEKDCITYLKELRKRKQHEITNTR